MNSRSEINQTEKGFVEVGTVTYKGREFSALGSVVDSSRAVVYLSPDMRHVQTWNGKELGTCKVVSSWPTPRSYVSSRWYAVRFTIGGWEYHGRTAGGSMVCFGKRVKSQSTARYMAV